MASSSSNSEPGAGRRGGGGQRGGGGGGDDTSSTSKKKQKDRANQESREAKRAAAGANADTKKDVFVDWKQNANEVTVRLRCGDGVQRGEDVNTTFTDTHCHACFPDGRVWGCALQEEIEGSCSRVQYKDKGSFLLLVMHKKIPFHTWPSLTRKEKEPLALEVKNGKEQPLSVKTEKPAPEAADRPKMAAQSPGPQPHTEPRRGKAERGVKRTMKNKTVDTPDSGVKGAGGEAGDKPAARGGEAALEPSAKRTVRPTKIVTKDPESQPIRDARPQSEANGKPADTPNVQRDSQTPSNGDNRNHRLDDSQQQTTTEAASSRTAQVKQKPTQAPELKAGPAVHSPSAASVPSTGDRLQPEDSTNGRPSGSEGGEAGRTDSEAGVTAHGTSLNQQPPPGDPGTSATQPPGSGPGDPGTSTSQPRGSGPGDPGPSTTQPRGSGPGDPGTSTSQPRGSGPGDPGPSTTQPPGSGPGDPGTSTTQPSGSGPGDPGTSTTQPLVSGPGDSGIATTQSPGTGPDTATQLETKQAQLSNQSSTEEEKRDQSKEEEPPEREQQQQQQEEEEEPMVNLAFVKNDSYEKGTDLMVVNVYMKGICRETARVLFREQDFTLLFQTSDVNFLRLNADCGANTVFKWQVKLRNLIQPEQCSYSFTPLRLDITLKKRHSQRWGGLEAPAIQGAVGGAKVAVPSTPSSLEKSQAGVSGHALPAQEEPPRVGEEKPKPPRKEDGGLDTIGPRSVSEHLQIKQELSVTPKPTCMVQPMTHGPHGGNDRPEEEEEKKVCLPGFTGLVNLGNTCFMNSVIQSLSNTRELRDYFHDRAFEREINCSNPLGTGGRLTIGFAVLLRALWKGTHHAFQPSKLKAIVASKASQFTGYAQHDAQEFMAFLLDGLHEDLNRIQNKPYTETVDSDGRLDEVVAEEAWQRHKMRNDSFIVDLFQGQYKSKLVCPMCSKVSITFDPFLYLPVPLPQKQKVLTVFFFAKEPHKKPIKLLVSVSKDNSSTAEVLESISRSVRIKAENLRLTEVVKSRFHRVFLPSHSLDTISSSDMLFCFEVLSKELAKERVVLLRVQQRPQVPSIPISKCAACLKPPVTEEDKLKRCTRCYRVGYCNQECQKNHWPNHKVLCRPNMENVGLPFLVSVPESRLTYARLSQLLEGYSRYSVNVFQPPFQSGRTSPDNPQGRGDLPPMPAGTPEGVVPCPGVEAGSGGARDSEQGGPAETPAPAHPAGGPDALSSLDPQAEKETSCEKAVRPEAAVTGYQQPSESASGRTPQFYISLLDSNSKEQKLEEKEEAVLEVPEDATLELVWKNNERLKEYVLVRSKELEYDEDPGSASETARAGHFTLEQCLNLFTKPEILAPEEAWYCPKCQQHREASKQLLLWRLPNILIIQLKRFSFRSFIWRDKINDMVDFPVRNLDLSKFCIGQKEDMQQAPVYDLYAVINHYGGMIGGHYTAYARLPSDKNSQRSDVGWRLFDDSTVTTVEESQVVTRYAYVLFYRRRNSPVERPPRSLGPLGAESPTAAGATANQASSQALYGTDLDPEGPPPLPQEVTSDLFGPSGDCSTTSYSNMEEVD